MYTPTIPTQLPKTCEQQKIWNSHEFWASITHAPKTWSLCGWHPMGSCSHTLKDLVLGGSLTKTAWVSSYILIQHQKGNNIYCHKHPLHQGYSHILTQGSKAKLSKTKNFVRRLRPQPPYILTRSIIIPIHPHLLNSHSSSTFLKYKPMESCHLLFSYN